MSPEAARLIMALNSAMTAVINQEMAKLSAKAALANLNDAMDEALEAKIIYARVTKAAERQHETRVRAAKSSDILTKIRTGEAL